MSIVSEPMYLAERNEFEIYDNFPITTNHAVSKQVFFENNENN